MIKDKIIQLLKIVDELRDEYKNVDKKFTLDGRFVGDIGEVLAAEIYKIELYKNSGNTLYDGKLEYSKKEVQIKCTMNNSFQYPREENPELLLALHIFKNELNEIQINEIYNGETNPIKNYIAKNRKKNIRYDFAITLNVLKQLNEQVDTSTIIEKR